LIKAILVFLLIDNEKDVGADIHKISAKKPRGLKQKIRRRK
jgi:hypothetical protein